MDAPVSAATSVRFGPFEIDLTTGDLRRSGRTLKLQPQPARILCLLAMHPGKLVTRTQLQQQTWGSDTFVDFNHGLNFSIRRIRACLGDDPENPVYIETVPRRGYRFIAPVQNGDNSGSRPMPWETEGPLTLGQYTVAREVRHEGLRPEKPRRYVWALAISLLVLSLTSILVYRLAPRPIRSLAVLPFHNPPAEEPYVAETLSEGLIHALSRLHNLKVISRASVVRFQGRAADPQTVGRELGVGAVLTGEFGQRGDNRLLTVELVDAGDGHLLWSGEYDWSSEAAYTIQSDIAREVARSLRQQFSPEELAIKK